MEQDSQENSEIDTDESRRSFMKKGALASGAVAVGLSGSGTVAAESSVQEIPDVAFVYAYDYTAGVPFQVIDRLQQRSINEMLKDADGNSLVTDPTDYNAYVGVYRPDLPGEFMFVLTRGGALQPTPLGADGAQTYNFETDPNFFISEINMLSVGLAEQGGGN